MDAVKFIAERNRMCDSFETCSMCPASTFSCNVLREIQENPAIVSIVEQWSKENPRKTRQSMFLKQWPEAAIDSYGVLNLCPTPISKSHRNIYGKCAHAGVKCDKCRREFWMQEVE